MAIRIPVILTFSETDIEKAKALVTLSVDFKVDLDAILSAEPKEVNMTELYGNTDPEAAQSMAAGLILSLIAQNEKENGR